MLKNPATAPISQMSRSLNPAARSDSRSGSSIAQGSRVSLSAKSSMARWRCESFRGAVIHRHQLAEDRIAGILPHGGTVSRDAIIAVIAARNDHGDHLALELGEARGCQHQIVIETGKERELGVVMGIGA